MSSLSDSSDTEYYQENTAVIPTLLDFAVAKQDLDRDAPYEMLGGLYDQSKVTRQQKRRIFGLLNLKLPEQRTVSPIKNYDLSEDELEDICQNSQESPNSSKSSSPSVTSVNDRFERLESIHQSLELNDLIGQILKQVCELKMALECQNALNTRNNQTFQRNGWTSPEAQLLFLEQLNNATFSPLFNKQAQVPIIPQGLDEQNRILINLLKDLMQANHEFIDFISSNQV